MNFPVVTCLGLASVDNQMSRWFVQVSWMTATCGFKLSFLSLHKFLTDVLGRLTIATFEYLDFFWYYSTSLNYSVSEGVIIASLPSKM